jgi:phenylacetic acid degradation operon negative regulatory protein
VAPDYAVEDIIYAVSVLKARETQVALSPFGNAHGGVGRSVLSSPSQSLIDKFGILQPQEVVLGLFGEYVALQERAWAGGLVQILGDLGFSVAASRVALNRVIARGLLAPTPEGRFVFYTITPRLKLVHDEGRRQTFSQVVENEWKGTWTIVWYSIPGEQRLERARLGRWLNLRGFGAIQDGTWIAPGDNADEVMALAKRLGVENNIVLFLGKLAEEIDVRATVERAWRVSELKRIYEVFVAEFSPLRKRAAIERLAPSEVFVTRTRLIEMFRQTTMHDPRVPDQVLGINWKRREAIETFNELQRLLKPAASDYFRRIAVTGGSETPKERKKRKPRK